MVKANGSLPGAPVQLSLAQARRLALHALGLLRRDPFGRGWRGAWRAIEHLGFIQLDTISVVERAPHHQLWSRGSNYRPADLDRLVSRERLVFEYWSHAAAYLPMSSYRYCLPRMRRYADKLHWSEHTPELAKAIVDAWRAARFDPDGPSAGNVDAIDYRPIATPGTRMAALRSGELDFVQDPSVQDIPRMKEDRALKVWEGSEFRVVMIGLDQHRDPLRGTETKVVPAAIADAQGRGQARRLERGIALGTDEPVNFFRQIATFFKNFARVLADGRRCGSA